MYKVLGERRCSAPPMLAAVIVSKLLVVNNNYYYNHFKFIYLFLAVLGPRCCAWAFSSCGEPGLLFVAVHGLVTAVAPLVAEHRL